jgi:hypothetical protein
MTHFQPSSAFPTQYGQSREERERTLACMRGHRDTWAVVQRQCNFSAFNGYHYTPSAWSLVLCGTCGRRWRTKAAYVGSLPDQPAGEST